MSIGTSHEPAVAKKYQRQSQLISFWALFAIDKSVSLAFGRPPILSSQYYEHIPLPDLDSLASFKPHKDSYDPKTQEDQKPSFGASFFLSNVMLGKLTGKITDFLYS
jgi:hypothetical protein